MRKSSKLLALLLTLCLLFGAITAILVSAEEGEATPAAPTLNVGDLTREGSGTVTFPATGNFNRNQSVAAAYELKGINYVTADVDFNVVNSGETASALKFEPSGAKADKTNVSISGHTVYIIERDGSYYLSYTSNDANPDERAKISNVRDVYDHLTYVMSIDTSTEGIYKLSSAFYVNGIFIDESEPTEITGVDSLFFYRFATKGTWGTATYDERNFVTNYYGNNEDGTASAKTVALEKALENRAPLYTFEGYENELGTVYNSTYVTPDAETCYVTVDGTPYTLVGEALDAIANIENGKEIIVTGRHLSAVAIPEGVIKFTVKLVGGGTFALNAASSTKYAGTVKEDGSIVYRNVELDYTSTDSYAYTNDFTAKKDAASHTLSNTAVGMGCENGTKAQSIQASYITANGNTYARIHTTGVAGTQPNRTGNFALRTDQTLEDRLRAFSYVTFDFDFCADQYAYAYGSQTITLTDGTTSTVPMYKTAASDAEFEAYINGLDVTDDVKAQYIAEGLASKALAFPDDNSLGLRLFFHCKGADGQWKASSTDGYRIVPGNFMYVCQNDDGVWYACKAKGNFDGAVKLSNEVGVFDHVSVVLKITDNTAEEYTVTPMYYINGEFFRTGASFQTAEARLTAVYADGMYADKVRTPADKLDDKYSLAFDNLALNYYTASDLANTTLDETVADTNLPLYTATGIVYSESYVTPDKTKYATIGLDDFKYYVIGAAFNKLHDDETIYLHNVGEFALPSGFALNQFTAVASDGVFVPAEADKVKYDITSDGNIHTFVLLRAYVLVNGTECTLDEAIEIITDGDEIELVRTNMENFNKELTSFTVKCDEYSNFTFASDFPTWKYAKIGDTYTKVINGEIKANLTLFSDRQQFNIYIPLPDAEMGTLEGVKYYVDATGETEDGNPDFEPAVIDGVNYLRLYWNTRMDMNGKTAYAELKYTDAEGNEAILLSRFEAKFEVVKYLIKAAQTFGCGNENAQVIKASGDFRYEVLKALGKTSLTSAYTAFYAVYEGHTDCQCGGIVDPDATGADYINKPIAPEADYINVGAKHENLAIPEGVSVSYGASGRYFYMYVYGKAGDTVTISYTTINGNATSKEETIGESGGKAFALFGAADIDNEFTITITRPAAEEGGEATTIGSFKYSLADYDIEANADVANLVKALKNYAIAAENFKKYVPEA